MSWTEAQKKRLQFERDILEKYFPNKVTWINPTGETKVEVAMNTNNGKAYTLRASLPKDYPNSCPDLMISKPKGPLLNCHGEPISYRDHSYGTNAENMTTICHFRAGLWTNEFTLYQVFMKGRIWLEAYEAHLETKKPMDDFLHEMPAGSAEEARQDLQNLVRALGAAMGEPIGAEAQRARPTGCTIS